MIRLVGFGFCTFSFLAFAGDFKVRYGNCAANINPDIASWSDYYPSTCLQGQVTALLGYASREPRWHEAYFGQGNAGLYFDRWLSLGISGESSLFRTSDSKEKLFKQKLNYAAVQLGSSGIHRHRLSGGRMFMPFGFNKRNLNPLFESLTSRDHWYFENRVVQYTYDNFLDTVFQIGLGNNGDMNDQSIAVRYMFDVSALEGTRLIASILAAKSGERKFGVAIYNNNSLGDEIHAEWVRSFHIEREPQPPFRQVLLIGYKSKFTEDGRWRAHIEDELKLHRLGTIEYDFPKFEIMYFSIGIAYQKAESEKIQSKWYATTAVNADL